MRKAIILLALAAIAAACTSPTAPTTTAHDCINGVWTGSGQTC